MANTRMALKIVDGYDGFGSLEDVLVEYEEAEVVELVKRALDVMVRDRKYRVGKAEKDRAMRGVLEGLAKGQGISLEDLLKKG